MNAYPPASRVVLRATRYYLFRAARRGRVGIQAGGLGLLVAGAAAAGPTSSSPIALTPDDRVLWVVNPSDDSVSVIRTEDPARIARIAVGKEPQSVALTPDGTRAYVANAADSTVTVIKINNPAPESFDAAVDTSVGAGGHITTGAEPWNVVCSPDGQRAFVANSSQDTITVINTATQAIIGNVDLRNSLANDPDRTRHFQPRGLAITSDNTKLYVTRFFSFTKAGGRQGDDQGKEGLVAMLNINTASTAIADYTVARAIPLSPQATGFPPPGSTVSTIAFPNQLNSLVIRGDRAYLPNIAASPSGPLRFDLNTQAAVNVINGVNGPTPVDTGSAGFLNLNLGARNPEAGKTRLFFANPWAMAFTTQSGAGNAYVASAASDVLVKLNVAASGAISFTGGQQQTRYIDLNDPDNPATSGANAGKNPQGIVINSTGQRAYVANFVSRNVSVVNLVSDAVVNVVPSSDLPQPGSQDERLLVGAEVVFSSRGKFDDLPGADPQRDRLSNEGWQACASCHFKGLTDGVVWTFDSGPRKTIPLNGTFHPSGGSQQRVLNYSAIFDEIEDFEINIRNVSGPGPLEGGGFDPNHGLLLGDNGSLDPGVLDAFSPANAGRPQLTVTLPGSSTKVPALHAMREWVRFAVRTPNSPLIQVVDPPTTVRLFNGRAHYRFACAGCHGGPNWTSSNKDFVRVPNVADLFTERTPPPTSGNPVGIPYLDRFLQDVGTFNLGVPAQGNPLGANIGAVEKASAAIVGGVVQAALDALGKDYNGDGKGAGYNVPSLRGLWSCPTYFHNGAAESLAGALSSVSHRSAGVGGDPFNPARLTELGAFVQLIDDEYDMFFRLDATAGQDHIVLSTGTLPALNYTVFATDNLATGTWTPQSTAPGTGRLITWAFLYRPGEQFFCLQEAP